jgi:hypothetical protein
MVVALRTVNSLDIPGHNARFVAGLIGMLPLEFGRLDNVGEGCTFVR